jgi:GT2 family glycosyltransferase
VVVECDVAAGIPAITAPENVARALVLVRLFGEPLGVLLESVPAAGLSPGVLAAAIVSELEPQLRERIEECGLSWRGALPTDGLEPPCTPRFIESRARVMRAGPAMTVAICTRDRPDGLAALLESLGAQEYPRLRIIVVDNAPSDDRTRRLVSQLAQQRDIAYVLERRPGLSWARNRAVEDSDGTIIAWADDDEICDRWWAAELARGFVEVPDADAVTGIVIPAELDTPSQTWFEEYSGVRRGRGFMRAVFSPATAHEQSPLYPLPPFGCGGNMAFRRSAIERIGGFDRALGAGTVTLAGEDTAALSEVLLTGGTIVYQPTAIVHHRHRRDAGALRRQLQGYGRGLTAFYTSTLVHHPSCTLELLRLGGQAAHDEFSQRGRRLSELDGGFPRDLLRARRVGLLQGPFTYAFAQLQVRRLERAAARS